MAKLAAFDMDGTLLMPDHRLGEKTLSALKRLRERDITLTFATGRHVLEMHHVIGEFSLDAFLITGNGTRIHSLEGEELYRQDLAPEAAEAVLHGKWDTQASMHVFNDGGWFTGQARPELLQAHVFSGFHYQLCCLRDELAKYPFADGGFVLFCHYRYLAVEYLLVAVLSNLSSMRVNENLDINPTHYLDINHADIVARIDLTEWETNPESTRYLTFLKGRVGRKVADFFMDFLGASEGLNAKAQNRGLLQAVDDFTAEAQLDKAERQNVRQQVYSYCNEQLQAGEEIELESLSKELAGVSEVSFTEFAAEKGYELEESFPADRSTLRQLTKFAGSGGGLTINFDAMLLGERIFWDPATDTLTIKGTPPNLRDQLQRRTSGGN